MSTEKTEMETNYVDASAADVEKPMAAGHRESHVICGCCCDTRRATIIVNIINAIFSVLALTFLSVFTSKGFASKFDDDQVTSELQAAKSFAWASLSVASLAIIMSGVGVYGALKFNKWMVLTVGIFHCAHALLSALGLDISGTVMSGFFAYPHFVLYREISKGIMTEEKYPNEKHSCCCV